MEEISVISTSGELLENTDVLSSENDMINHEDDIKSLISQYPTDIFDHYLVYPTAVDPSVIKFLTPDPRNANKHALTSATVAALVVELTSPESIDYQFLLDFFLTYRMFLKTDTLMEILLTRFLWAYKLTLQIEEPDSKRVEIGKLVLIRTFVTIRHWLLNYFQDDFINNSDLKYKFISFMNDISQLTIEIAQGSTEDITLNIEIATRILTEMKKVYINLCSIYWSTIPLDHIPSNEILLFQLSLYEHMNNTRLSTVGLLQTFDPAFRRSGILSLYNNKSDSATNLLLQRHNENKQKNLANFLHNNQKNKRKPFQIFTENDEHFLHPKDSLMSLNKSYNAKKTMRTPLKQTITNIIQDEIKYTPLDGVRRLSKNELDDSENDNQRSAGFIVNGQIRVFTDSKIDKIVPTTPNKRPRQKRVINQSVNVQQKQVELRKSKHGVSKGFLSWLKHFHNQKVQVQPSSVGRQQIPESTKRDSEITLTDKNTLEVVPDLQVRGDFLSARIIEEFQYLLSDDAFKSRLSKQLQNEQFKRQSVFSIATLLRDNVSMDEENTFEMTPSKKFNREAEIMLERDVSFEAPSVSFNWTDSFNEISNSSNQGALNDVVPSMINDLKINDNESEEQEFNPETLLHDNVANSDSSAVDNELDNDQFSRHVVSDFDALSTSMKSYLSYDSDLSAEVEQPDEEPQALRKKSSNHDLRATSPKKNSHVTISLAKQEYSNIMTLRDLPYALCDISGSKTSVVMRNSSSFFDLVKEYRLSLKEDEVEREGLITAQDLSIRSIEEDTSDEDSIGDYESTLSRIGPVEGEDHNEYERRSVISMIPSIHSSVIMPFPGLDSAAIAELAAIPDDSFTDDPINALLMKLEGKYDKKEPVGQVLYGLNDEQSLDDESIDKSIDEVKLQNRVRDLFITNRPGDEQDEPRGDALPIFEANPDMFASTPYKPADEQDSILTDTAENTFESLLKSTTHVSFVLSYSSLHLAEQLTVIEKDALYEIDWKDLIELRWDRTVEPINSWLEVLIDDEKKKSINLVVSRFNLLINWIVSEILLTTSLKERRDVVTRFIHIAQHCHRLQNYSTLMQIVLALTSARISGLKKTWDIVALEDRITLESLENLASPFKNFASLRNDSSKIVPSKGCIPFLGLFLSDLTFNAERPNFFKKGDPNDSQTSIDRSLIDDYSQSEKLINFAKFRTAANVTRSLIQCIEWSKLYSIKVDHDVVSKCLYIKSLSDEEMSICLGKLGE